MSETKTVAAERRNLLLAAIAGLIAGVILMQLWARPTGDRAATEAVVRDYILANPEILPEAMQRLQARETGRAISANRSAIETPFGGSWAGAENGDVVLVEFFDYACGFCRQSVADVDRLLAEDKKLKVVFRELPVLGPPSEAAARVSLAAANGGQARFMTFHRALYGGGRPTEASIRAAAASAGVAAIDPGAAGERELQSNMAVAAGLGINGTPAFVVGDRVMAGAVGYEALKAAVAAARDKG